MTSLGKAVRVSTTQTEGGADTGGGIATVICGVDLVRGGHHLGATPGLVKPDIADNLQPAVAKTDGRGPGDKGRIAKRRHTEERSPRGGRADAGEPDDLRHPPLFGGDRRRQPVTQLRRVGPHPPTGVPRT